MENRSHLAGFIAGSKAGLNPAFGFEEHGAEPGSNGNGRDDKVQRTILDVLTELKGVHKSSCEILPEHALTDTKDIDRLMDGLGWSFPAKGALEARENGGGGGGDDNGLAKNIELF